MLYAVCGVVLLAVVVCLALLGVCLLACCPLVNEVVSVFVCSFVECRCLLCIVV